MFRLRQKIRDDKLRSRGLIRHNHDLSWSSNRIDPDNAKHQLLRGRNVLVSRSGYLVDSRYGLRTERQRRNSLRATNRVDLCHAQLQQRSSDRWILRQRSWRRGDDNSLNTRDLRRHRVHHDGRRIRRSPAGSVQPHAFKWCNALAQANPIDRCDGPRLFDLTFVKRPYVSDGFTKRANDAFVSARSVTMKFVLCDAKFRRLQINLVESRRVINERLVATRAHVVDDRRHDFHQLRVQCNRTRSQMFKQRTKRFTISRTKELHCTPFRALSSAWTRRLTSSAFS